MSSLYRSSICSSEHIVSPFSSFGSSSYLCVDSSTALSGIASSSCFNATGSGSGSLVAGSYSAITLSASSTGMASCTLSGSLVSSTTASCTSSLWGVGLAVSLWLCVDFFAGVLSFFGLRLVWLSKQAAM